MEVGAMIGDERYTVEDYYNTPERERVELINGLFYDMAAPNRVHQGLIAGLTTVIKNYIDSKNGDCKVYPAPFDVQLSENEDTVVQPDISVICDRDKLTDKGCVGAPDWIIEIISPATASYDYITKYRKYGETGVREYWIIDPAARTIVVRDYSIGGMEPDCFYTFEDKVKAGIYEDLEIDFAELEKSL